MTAGPSLKPSPGRGDSGMHLMSKLTSYLNGRNVFGGMDGEKEGSTGNSNIPYTRSSSASTPVTATGTGKLRRRRGSTGEISQVRQRYKLGEVMGNGAFSSVRLAVDRQTGKEWAAKILRLPLPGSEPDDGESTLDEIVNEVRVLQTIGHHPSLTYLREYFLEGDKVYMILQLVRGGELLSALVERGSLPEEDARQILGTVLEGIAHLHRCGVAHRDLKLENLLLVDPSDITSVKIADFGLSKRMHRNKAMQTVCGTPMYVSPEALNLIDNRAPGNGYGPECDLWACGIIMFILLGGYPPFVDSTKGLDEGGCVRLFRQIQRGDYSFQDPAWELVSDEAKDLVRRFLQVDPKQRITAKDALRHPWFTGDKMSASRPSVCIKLECDSAWMNDGVLISSSPL
jgi:serine/threonine protein kinase